MKNKLIIIVAVVLGLAGLALILYPTVSDFINRIHSSHAIQEFIVNIEDLSEEEKQREIKEAEAYNQRMLDGVYADVGNRLKDYYEILNFANGMMGYIEIEKIDVELPIYHGVSAEVLSKGVGHVPQSTFPVGGKGYHPILTAHTGLPSAELFTDLVELTEGDVFRIHVADRELIYMVDQIKVVLPHEIDDIQSVPENDYCTLVTCTPYGINSHRLLVRGVRIDSEDDIPPMPISDNSITFPVFPWVELSVFILSSMTVVRHIYGGIKRDEENC